MRRLAQRTLRGTPLGWPEWLPPVLILTWGAVELANAQVRGSRVLLGAALGVGCAALVLRRRWPLVVVGVVIGATLLPVLVGADSDSAARVIVLAVAVFAVGRWGTRPWCFVGVAAAVLLLFVGSMSNPAETVTSSLGWSLNALWIFGVGSWLQQAEERVRESRLRADAAARTAKAEERVRIARDLHDVMAHSLSIIVVQSEVADELLESSPAQARQAVDTIARTSREALAQTRAVLGDLRSEEPVGVSRLPGLVALF
ncbi:MAG: histidine kinase dimerization/phosphoacceptor domain-containing protein [Dermatophilaceae bacterium]